MGAGEAALDVAEQLAFDQLLGDGRAVDLHERRGRARAGGVNGVRHQLLARPALAVDQHAPVGGGHQRELLAQRLHGHALPDDAVARAAVGAQAAVLDGQPAVFQRVLGHHRNLLDGQRLFQEVERAQLGGLHRRFDAPVARDDHHHGALRERDLLDARQHLHAVDARQPDIQEHQLEFAAGQGRQARFAALHGRDGVGFILQHAAQGLADVRFVVHHQDAPQLHDSIAAGRAPAPSAASASTMAGSSTVKRAPTGWLSSTRIWPLCSATMWLTMARPTPVPRFLVEK